MIFLILFLIGIRTILVNVLGERSFDIYDSLDLFSNPLTMDNETVILIGRITTAAFIAVSLIGIFHGLLFRKFRLPRQGSPLFFAGLLLYLPTIITSLISENGGFSYKLLFFPLLMITIYLSPRFDLSKHVNKIQFILLIFIYSSLVSALIDPKWAFSNYAESWIGLPIRLYGTSSHPNGLASIALTCLILARLKKRHTVWFYLNHIAALVVIILTQSKAVWAALLAWWIIEWVIKNFSTHRQKTIRVVTSLLALLILTATYFLVFQKNLWIANNITLTGRVEIWRISVKTWLENPLFGYGPTFWDIHFRQLYGFPWAGQSHNQVLQTLGETGLLGFASLIIYFFVVIKNASRAANSTNFATWGILAALVIRSFFEAPLRNYGLDESFLVHAVFFIVLINAELLFIRAQGAVAGNNPSVEIEEKHS